MCGIAGILDFKANVSRSRIISMTDIMAHRGPDGEGHFLGAGLALGHRRLAILDLTEAAHQPMQTDDERFIITYNGEIYNHREIRKNLEALGHQFKSRSDTEVVLKAYAQWGDACVKKFNGMFAFAIWDTHRKNLFIARDRYGIKPLYYLNNGTAFIFASEVKAIIASGYYTPTLDAEALVEYLTFQNFFTNKTLHKNILMLMPGHYANISSPGKMEITQYWDFVFTGDLFVSEDEMIEETNYLFKKAVEKQLHSDVPVNSYLSGGIDSGAISMIASQSRPNLKTFTIGFDLSSATGLELSFDERAKAEYISYLAKTEHYEMVLKAGDMERCMDDYVWHLEEPRVGQSYPNYYAAKLASKFGKVVLSGSGGDEFFGGYPWRYHYGSAAPTKMSTFLDKYYLKWQRLLDNKTQKELLHPIWDEVKHVSTKDIFSDVFKSVRKESLTAEECINSSFYLEAKTFLHGLLVVEDKLSMAHSLETRLPFLDNDLVDFALKIPPKIKVTSQGGKVNENDLAGKVMAHKNGKHILRKAFSRFLDEKITSDTKQGFSSPDASWFRGESIDYVKNELQNSPDIFNTDVIQSILNKHSEGLENNRLAIWSLLYLKKYLPNMNTKFKYAKPSRASLEDVK